MFGLTALETKLAVIAGGLVLALIVLGTFAWHERSVGAMKCIQGDEKAAAEQDVHNAAILAQGQTTVYQEASDYHEAVSTPVAHPVHVSVCQPPSSHQMHPATPTGSLSDGTSALSGSDHAAAVPDESLGPELQAVGRDADAQVNELRDYILRVCSVR